MKYAFPESGNLKWCFKMYKFKGRIVTDCSIYNVLVLMFAEMMGGGLVYTSRGT